MRPRLGTCLVISLALALAACGAAAVKPTPQERLSSEFPDNRYVRAVGSGQSEQEARERALSELARIFTAQVRSEALDNVRSALDAKGIETYTQEVESRVKVVSDIHFEGAEIAATWRQGLETYAMAVLDRSKARRIWGAQLDDLDSRIEGRFSALRQQQGSLVRYRTLKAIEALWIERTVYASRLRVLGYGASAMAAYDISAALSEIESARSKVAVHIDINSTYAAIVRSELAEEIGKAGFLIADMKNAASVLVTGSINTMPLEIEHPDWKYARAIAALQVADAESGIIVGEVSLNERASHLSFSEAEVRAVKKVLPTAAREIISLLEQDPEAEKAK